LWGNNDLDQMSWMDLPPSSALHHAKTLLQDLGALTKEGPITSHGQAMAKYPMHPRLAHMMLKAKELDLSYEASLLAVLISEKDIYTKRYTSSCLRERVSTLHDINIKKHQDRGFVNIKHCQYLLKNAKRIEPKQNTQINLELLGVLLAFAYPDRIAKLRNAKSATYLLANAKGAKLHEQDDLFNTGFLVIADVDAKNTNASIYKAIALSHADIESHLQEHLEVYEDVLWNEEHARVEAKKVTKLGAIVLKSVQSKNPSQEKVIEVLLEELEVLGLDALTWSKEAQTLRERVNFLREHDIDLPDFSDSYLLEQLDVWLSPYLSNIHTLKAFKGLDLQNILLGQLSFEQTQTLDKLAPSKLKVASGSHIALDYTDPKQPILAVRLQEMFGTQHTPTILGGKVKLMIHLLSPASRPMQVTQDLESFWKNTYADVKKELRGKYKRHYWPDNPLEAKATSRTKKFM